jgi:LmbE family N-acetylglucosaminyl deacetylase
MRTLVAIGAHHDDIELRCGGTLARYVREGWRVVYAVATASANYKPLPAEEEARNFPSNAGIVEMRREESRRGAAALGVSDVNFFDFKCLHWYAPGTLDRRYFDGHGTTEADFRQLTEDAPGREFIVTATFCAPVVEFLCDFLVQKKADVVLTHFPDDCHPEHYATALLVGKCVRRLAEAGRKIDFYGWEQGAAGSLAPSFAPTHFVDVSDTMDLKCAALMNFVSQHRDHNPEMFMTRARKRAREYGELVGVEYAEPFVKLQVPAVSHMELNLPAGYDAGRAARRLECSG